MISASITNYCGSEYLNEWLVFYAGNFPSVLVYVSKTNALVLWLNGQTLPTAIFLRERGRNKNILQAFLVEFEVLAALTINNGNQLRVK
jgi:hypothetical protein